MIEICQLEKKFGSVLAIQSLDLSIQPGEIVGLLGPNGAGKTTTLRVLTGMIQPTSDSARVASFDVVEDPVEAKKRVGYVPETGALFDHLSAAEYLNLVATLLLVFALFEALRSSTHAPASWLFFVSPAKVTRFGAMIVDWIFFVFVVPVLFSLFIYVFEFPVADAN